MTARLRTSLRLGLTLTLFSVSLTAQGGPPPGLPPVPVPSGNPITAEKALLGKTLFWDEQLSSSRSVSCGTCHIPTAGGVDPRSLFDNSSLHPGPDELFGTDDDIVGSRGVILAHANGLYESAAPFAMVEQVTARQAPSMINAAFSPLQFWDGRATGTFLDPVDGSVVLAAGASLENQAVGPPVSAVEMGHLDRNWGEIVVRLNAVQPLALAAELSDELSDYLGERDYPALFAEAFPLSNGSVSAARIALAIATYERTLISDQTPFDNFLAGQQGALTAQQNQGRMVFNGAGRCNICHSGPLLTDNVFHAVGVRPPIEDLGRGAITGLPMHNGRFKTPGLRNVALRAPYFHNGGMQTLEDVVDFYDRGGDFPQNQAPQIIPLGLSQQQKNALIAFLDGALTDPRVAAGQAPFDRPALYSESARQPELFGEGGAGSGGFVPRAVALEPALLGNSSMTLGVAEGLGGATLIVGLDLAISAPGTHVRGAPFLLGGTPSLHFYSAGTLSGTEPGEGASSVAVAIPNEPLLTGIQLIVQWFVLDAAAPGGVASSNGTRFQFFGAN